MIADKTYEYSILCKKAAVICWCNLWTKMHFL